MNMGKSLNCPDCNSRVQFCINQKVTHKRIINPKTGELFKRVECFSDPDISEMSIECPKCSWCIFDGSPEWNAFVKECDQKQLNEFIESFTQI